MNRPKSALTLFSRKKALMATFTATRPPELQKREEIADGTMAFHCDKSRAIRYRIQSTEVRQSLQARPNRWLHSPIHEGGSAYE